MAEFTDRPGYSFDPGPPPEASRFFRGKSLRPSFSFEDVEPEEHAVAFAVAKAAGIDVLSAIQAELQSALDDGRTFQDFKTSLRPKLEELGWWGYGEARDPLTGAVKAARLGTPRRLKTIYHANIRSARAAGQWERIQRTRDALPYLEYRLGPSERHRPHHAAKEGLVLPADDPFWATWFPQNGWGCKCWVRQLTRAAAEAKGIDTAPPIKTREVINKRTGEVKQVPVGIDPGWERNPGALRLKAAEDFLAGKLNAADPAIARAAVHDIATSWRVKRLLDGGLGSAPVAMLPEELAAQIGAEGRVVSLTEDAVAELQEADMVPTPEDMARLAELIETGAHRRRDDGALVFVGSGETPLAAVVVLADDSARAMLAEFGPR